MYYVYKQENVVYGLQWEQEKLKKINKHVFLKKKEYRAILVILSVVVC